MVREDYSPEERPIETVVLKKLMRLNAVIHGVVFGIMTGLIIFIATLWLVIKGGPVVGPTLGLLGQFFYGYQVSFWGSFVGFGYGFLSGFLVGYLVAFLYNWIVDLRQPKG
jgi:hypothetical protein